MTRSTVLCLAAALLYCGMVAAEPELSRDDAQDVIFLAPTRPIVIRLYVQVDGKPAPQLMDAWIKDLFAFLDRDGNGTLSGEEAERAPNAQGLVQRLQQGYGFFTGQYQTTPLGLMDANDDGKVTPAELSKYYHATELGAPRLTPIQGSAASSDAMTDILFKVFDKNQNGKLSPDELSKAAEVLTKLDGNDDETIGVAELVPGVQPMNNGRREEEEGMTPRRGQTNSAFFMVSSRLDLAQQILNRYDTNKDGVVTSSELELDDATFKKLDLNGDTDLSGPELIRMVSKTADVELIIRIGTGADKAAAVEMIQPEKDNALVKSKASGGGIMLSFGNSHLDLRPATTVSFATQAVEVQKRQVGQIFKQLDTAKRGWLDKQDVNKPQGRLLVPYFDAADRDADGKLTEKEVLALLELDGRAGGCCVTLTAGETGRGLFELMDGNRDGRLTVREMRTACDRIPGDNKDFITRGMLPRQFGMSVAQGAIGAAGRQPVPGGMAQPGVPANSGRTGPIWFRKMDANGDGEVSRREWLGPAEDLKQLDLDGDGVLSPEEAFKADATRKQ